MMKFSFTFLILILFFLNISCSKEKKKISIVKEDSLEMQMIEAYREGLVELDHFF